MSADVHILAVVALKCNVKRIVRKPTPSGRMELLENLPGETRRSVPRDWPATGNYGRDIR
jgi:hypothetical protein